MLAMMCACTNPKDAAKEQLINAYENVDRNSEKYTDEDWLKFADQYHEADSLISVHEGEYTVDEMNEIKSIKRKCTLYLVKATAVKAKIELEELGGEMKEGINDLLK